MPKQKTPWPLIIYSLLLVAAGVALVSRLGSLATLLATLRAARAIPLVVAVALQLLSLVNQAALYAALYRLVGMPMRWKDMAIVVWAGHFMNVAAPAGGLGSTALLIADGRRRGLDTARVSLASTLYLLFNFVWFAILLVFALVALWSRGALKAYEVAAASFVFAGILLAAVALIALSISPARVSALVGRAAARVNKLLRRELVPVDAVAAFAAEFAAAVAALRSSPARLAAPVFHTFWVDGLEIAVLAACFAAFPGNAFAGAAPISLAVAITGYAIGTLFLVVSVTPQGLGVVEGVMTAIFVSLGIPLERAAVVVLAYRGLSFWLPLVVGTLASRSALLAPPRGPANV